MTDTLPGSIRFGEGLTPPQAIDAERAVLAALLLDHEAVGMAVEMIEPEAFYRSAHRKMFEAVTALYNRNEKADLITLSEELRKRGELELVGGEPALAQILEYATTASNLEQHVKIIRAKAVLRGLIKAASEIQQEAFAGSDDTAMILDRAEERIFAITDQRVREGFLHIRDLLKPAFEHIQGLFERKVLITGVPSGYDDLDKYTAGFQNSDLIILAGRPAMGKCLTGDTLIDDPDTGARRTIEECVRERMPNVMGISEPWRVRVTPIGDWIDSGVKPCFRVTTRLGRSVDVTGHHPFLTVKGWTPLHDLGEGVRIALPRTVPVFGPDESWSMERVRLLAYFIAEGGLTSETPRFTNTEPVLVADFAAAIEQEFPECHLRRQQDEITYAVPQRSPWCKGVQGVRPNPLTVWLQSQGLMGKRSTEKSFPAAVWTWTRERMAEFLRILFSCDATIYPMSGYPRIEFTVASEALARDVHHALCRFGVVAKFWRKTERSWRVEITDPHSVGIYQREIGWLGEKESRFPLAAVDSSSRIRRSHCGQAPREAWELVGAAAARRGMVLTEAARLAGEPASRGYNLHIRRGITQRRLAGFARALEDPTIERLASPDLYWDEILSIEPIGNRHVFDLTVPDGANFIANDVCVHNTSAALNMAENAAIKARIPVAVFSLEMAKEQLVQRLLCSQGGVALHRVRNGSLTNEDWPRLTTAAGLLTQAPIMIDDSANVSLMEIRAKCRRLKSEGKLGFVVIDYLQLIRPGTAENRVQEISQITRGLKMLAKELNVPILALSQLSRAVETRDKSGRPQLSDLRESGCLTADTRIQRADTGAEVTLGELLERGERNIPIWTLNADLRLQRGVMTHVFPSGSKEIYALRLATGRTVKASANHPFLTLDGWKPLSELATGMRLATPRRIASPMTESRWAEPEIVLLAHMLGDGCFASRQPIHYTSSDPANLEAVEQAAVHFNITPRRVVQDSWTHVYLPSPYRVTHGRRNPVRQWLASLSLDGLRSHQKFVPPAVFGLEDSRLALFLHHLWATDGCIHRGRDGAVRIYYASNSRRLIEDVHALLLRFGVMGRIKVIRKAGYRDVHHLHVYGARQQLRFLEQIGCHGRRGEPVPEICTALRSVFPNTNVDTIPSEVSSRVRHSMKERHVTARKLAAGLEMAYCGSTLYRCAPSRARLERVAALLEDDELHRLARSDVFWDRIVAIEPLGVQPVFDATVPGTHNFIANGIVAHNSIEQDSDVVMFVYREEVYKPDTAEHGKALLIIAKQRNGPTAEVPLTFLRESTKFVPYSPVMVGETEPEF